MLKSQAVENFRPSPSEVLSSAHREARSVTRGKSSDAISYSACLPVGASVSLCLCLSSHAIGHYRSRELIAIYTNVQNVITDVCHNETKTISCSNDSVMLIESASYGRMEGTCLKNTEYGHLNCSADVSLYLKRICSGRQSCQLEQDTALDRSNHGCPADLSTYLSVTHHCLELSFIVLVLFLVGALLVCLSIIACLVVAFCKRKRSAKKASSTSAKLGLPIDDRHYILSYASSDNYETIGLYDEVFDDTDLKVSFPPPRQGPLPSPDYSSLTQVDPTTTLWCSFSTQTERTVPGLCSSIDTYETPEIMKVFANRETISDDRKEMKRKEEGGSEKLDHPYIELFDVVAETISENDVAHSEEKRNGKKCEMDLQQETQSPRCIRTASDGQNSFQRYSESRK